MIELVLTIVVLAIMSLMVVPQMGNMWGVQVDAAAQKLKADIRYAQNLATTTEGSYGFRTTGNSTYEVYNAVTMAVVLSPFHNTPMQEDLVTNFGNVSFQNPNQSIIFDSLGRATTNGGNILQVNGGNVVKQIQINPTSGLVDLL